MLQAVKLSPDSEKDLIRDKLAEAKQKMRQAAQGEADGRGGTGTERAGVGVAVWPGSAR